MSSIEIGELAKTATRILDAAENLVSSQGFNGFSYSDVSKELGLTNAALHYHFAGKSDLGEALVSRYTSRFISSLLRIEDETSDPMRRLESYVELYEAVLRDHRMCLCGMMAAEFETLSVAVRNVVLQFFGQNESWLSNVLQDGRESGLLEFSGSSQVMSRTMISGLEGSMLLARLYGDMRTFDNSAQYLLTALRPSSAVPQGTANGINVL